MKLHHCHDARWLRPLWPVEEMGIDYAVELLRFAMEGSGVPTHE